MTPYEKTKDLIEKFNVKHHHKLGFDVSMMDDQIKKCALIAVDEILSAGPYSPTQGGMREYWQKVKSELEVMK